MTSSPIFDMGVMMPAAQPMMPAKSAATDAGSFEQAIEQVTKGYDQDQKTDYQADTTKASKDVTKDENISQNAVKEKQTETDTAEDNQNTVVEEAEKALTEEEITVVDEAKEQLLEDIAAILNMTPAQLQSTLDTMGLQLNDLLEQENVNLLVSNVLGNGDPMELVLNEELSQAVFDINQKTAGMVSEIAEKLNLGTNQVTDLLQSMESESNVLPVIETKNASLIPKGQAEETVIRDVLLTTDTEKTQTNVSPVTENSSAEETQPSLQRDQNQESMQQKHDNDRHFPEAEMRENHFTSYQNAEAPAQQVHAEAPQNLFLQNVDAQEVIDQITDYMRNEVKGTISSIQLQLHPESLGNIGLTVASKDGNVTAQFTAQNEAVKAALESQIVVLKENLEQQGVKVEAVEVTVASHEFEQNLEEDNRENMQQQEEQERLRKATRKLDLGAFGDADALDGIDQEDEVTVKMMQADGNSMDYKV